MGESSSDLVAALAGAVKSKSGSAMTMGSPACPLTEFPNRITSRPVLR